MRAKRELARDTGFGLGRDEYIIAGEYKVRCEWLVAVGGWTNGLMEVHPGLPRIVRSNDVAVNDRCRVIE